MGSTSASPAESSDRRIDLEAPIVGVVVHPSAARVTRRGRVTLPAVAAGDGPAGAGREAGEETAGQAAGKPVEVVLGGLPLDLDPESVRVSGTGPARVLGVDVVAQVRSRLEAGTMLRLEARRDELLARRAELDDEDETARARRAFLDVAARVGAGALARRLADGPAGDAGEQLASVGDALAAQISAVHARRRELAAERRRVDEEIAAVERMIEARRRSRDPDTRAVVVTLEPVLPAPAGTSRPAPAAGSAGPAAGAPGKGEGGPAGEEAAGEEAAETRALPIRPAVEVEIEVSYLVRTAGWTSAYDIRLEGERVTLTWFAMISQRSGEDWPEADLRLSTARPSATTALPELRPQFVDIRRPPPVRSPRPLAMGPLSAPGGPPPAPAGGPPAWEAELELTAAAAPLAESGALLDSTGPASVYRPPRPIPVPADGDPHRATVAVIDLDAVLDHLTVPKITPEVYLRATVTNTSPHTLLPGRASIFHGQDFVGTTELELLPPGAEIELHLGVDNRMRVERELVRRSTGRRVVGNARRTDVAYQITVGNHSPLRTKVTVRDQVPVSRHDSIVIRDVTADPAPAEQTDLGLLTWKIELEPGESRRLGFSFRMESPRGAEVTGLGD